MKDRADGKCSSLSHFRTRALHQYNQQWQSSWLKSAKSQRWNAAGGQRCRSLFCLSRSKLPPPPGYYLHCSINGCCKCFSFLFLPIVTCQWPSQPVSPMSSQRTNIVCRLYLVLSRCAPTLRQIDVDEWRNEVVWEWIKQFIRVEAGFSMRSPLVLDPPFHF